MTKDELKIYIQGLAEKVLYDLAYVAPEAIDIRLSKIERQLVRAYIKGMTDAEKK